MKHLVKTTCLLIFLLLLFSYCNSSATTKVEKTVPPDTTSSSQQATAAANDSLIKGALTSKEGHALQYQFDNIAHTMTITFNNETAVLKQDTTASGIKYANEHFTYTEWHGNSTLMRDGKTVFTNQ